VIDLAYAMGPTPQSGGGIAAVLPQLVPIVLVLGIFFFLVIRPQQRDRRNREQMLAALKKGDRVITSGGLIGTIVNVTDRRVTLKLGDSVRVECVRSAITGLESENRADADSA
jgi:preprotein translocase subunit YajC